MRLQSWTTCLAIVVLLAHPKEVAAATLFTEDFSNQAALPGPFLVQSPGGPAPTFVGGDAIFGGAGVRTYLRTVDSDYASESFVAEVSVRQVETRTFFGMGAGERDAFFFDEPMTLPFVMVAMEGYPTDQDIHISDNSIENVPGIGEVVVAGSLDRVRMTYDREAGTVQFAFDQSYDGVFSPTAFSVPINVGDNGFDSTNARIFFGSSNDGAFRDLVITSYIPGPAPGSGVPEPGSLALLGIAAATAVRRGRR